MILIIACADNEIDGQAFLDLTESHMKFLTPKLGVVKKLFRLKQVGALHLDFKEVTYF